MTQAERTALKAILLAQVTRLDTETRDADTYEDTAALSQALAAIAAQLIALDQLIADKR